MAHSVSNPDGVLCPLITPFDDGSVDHETLATLIDHVRHGGINGLVPCGTTGEFASLTLAEHEQVIQTTVEHAGDLPVIAGAAATHSTAVEERIRMAANAGADAVLITLPYFHVANDPAGQREFLETVADDASLPIYLYNIPACAGQRIEPAVLEQVAKHDRIAGLKDSSGDLDYLTETLRRTPATFQVFEGYDSQLFPALLSGATGGINALSNVIPTAFTSAYEAATDEDFATAREIQATEISPLFQACTDHGFAPTCKTALEARGIIESPEVRPPLVSLPADARERIKSLVTDSPPA